ncbi:MAG: autotransporter outer membrane beta-barrel domain-containing protein, partial [Deltaproteobacteria bacterium]|nr:autotransporter outer membrane beta-barrel domain-containing protein [Deltaproteobacteria bacterium]
SSVFLGNFVYNDTPAGESIGGAINVGSLSEINDSYFFGNYAKSEDGEAEAGAIMLTLAQTAATNYVTTVKNTQFYGNYVSSTTGGEGGAIYVNLTQATSPPPSQTYELKLIADANKTTDFIANKVNGESSSIYITGPQRDVTLTIAAAASGRVQLLDPIKIDLTNGKNFNLTDTSSGTFIWGGKNNIQTAGGGTATVTFSTTASSVTALTDGFQLYSESGTPITAVFNSNNTVILDLTGRDPTEPFFKGVTSTTYTSGKFSARYQSLVDTELEFVVGDTASFTGTPQFVSYVDPNLGTTTTLTATSAGKLKLTYTGSEKIFQNLTPSIDNSRGALNEMIVTYSSALQLDSDGIAVLVEEVVKDAENITAEPYVSQVTAGFGIANDLQGRAILIHRQNLEIQLAQNGIAPSAGSEEGSSPRIFLEYIGTHVNHRSHDGYSGYTTILNGGLLGFAVDFNSGMSIGGWFALSTGDTDFDNLTTTITTDVVQGGLFADYNTPGGGFVGTVALSLAELSDESTRRHSGNVYRTDYNQQIFSFDLLGGYAIKAGESGFITPYINLNYQKLTQDAFQETGTGPNPLFPIESIKKNFKLFNTTIGINFKVSIPSSLGMFTPGFSIGWNHQGGDIDAQGLFGYVGPTGVTQAKAFLENGITSRNSLELGATLTLASPDGGPGVRAGYNASLKSHYVEQNYFAGFEYKF